MRAWYFAPLGNRLRFGDNRPIRAGITHRIEGEPKICKHGLHGSIRVMDALAYAESSVLYRVELSGKMDHGDDKISAQSRRYLKRYEIDGLLKCFARRQALIHIEKIKPYTGQFDLIVEYLETGREDLRDAARDASRAAAWDASRAAAEDAAWAAARAAAGAAAEAAARDAARAAAGAAVEDAARAAAWTSAWTAAEDAARAAADKMLTNMIAEQYGAIDQ